jgi:hypothetical protein
MTIDSSYLASYTNGLYAVSPASGTGTTVSSGAFALYLNLATKQFNQDNPGIADTDQIDECICLLICSKIAGSDGKLDLTGEKEGTDYSYTRNAGLTSWDLKYKEILSEFKTGTTPRLIYVEHEDAAYLSSAYNLL